MLFKTNSIPSNGKLLNTTSYYLWAVQQLMFPVLYEKQPLLFHRCPQPWVNSRSWEQTARCSDNMLHSTTNDDLPSHRIYSHVRVAALQTQPNPWPCAVECTMTAYEQYPNLDIWSDLSRTWVCSSFDISGASASSELLLLFSWLFTAALTSGDVYALCKGTMHCQFR